jgi:YVTN family beta-propeller protein
MRILFLVLLATILRSVAAASDYQPVTTIPISGEGGWDILTIDDASRRLYLSHASKIVVVDIDANKVVGEIADTPGVHAFVPVPKLNRGFSSNGKENKTSVVDLKTLKTVDKVNVGENPDAIAYDAKHDEVYVFNHSGNSATVLNAKDAKLVATIPLGGSPEFPAVDSARDRVYVNLEDKSEVAVIDVTKHAVVARWPIAPGEEASGLGFDPAHHRLFATCHNKMMVMLDSDSGKVMANVPISGAVDGCVFDETTQLVFASCGEGQTIIAKENSPNDISVVQQLQTQRGARTIALDPKTHRIYLPTADFGPPPSPNARPSIVPNTMRLLVYGPEK